MDVTSAEVGYTLYTLYDVYNMYMHMLCILIVYACICPMKSLLDRKACLASAQDEFVSPGGGGLRGPVVAVLLGLEAAERDAFGGHHRGAEPLQRLAQGGATGGGEGEADRAGEARWAWSRVGFKGERALKMRLSGAFCWSSMTFWAYF